MELIKVYMTKYWKYLLFPMLAMFFVIGIDSSLPYLQKIFFDTILLKKDSSLLLTFIFVYVGIALTRSIMGYFKEYMFDVFSVNVSREIRLDLYKKFQSFEFSYFDKNNTGELLSRISEDVDIVWETVSYGFRLLIEGIILFIISVYLMSTLSLSLTVVCVLVLMPISILSIIVEKKFWAVYSKISDQTAEINTTAQQDISGIRLVKAFARERYEISKFLNVNKQLFKLNLEQAKIVSNFIPTIEFLTNLAPIAMILYGGYLTMNGELTIGTLVAFSSYILNLSWCVRMLGGMLNLLSQNKASMDKIIKILRRESKITSKVNAYAPTDFKGDIEFKNVSFTYNSEVVLKNINLKIPNGTTVALMGPTGSGKSTLLSLIGRYYDVMDGEILVDGVNIKDWDLGILRDNMGVVFQETFLFSDTIKENILFGQADNETELIKACTDACAYDFIQNLEAGFDTVIGERGLGLSGGQKQRLAITRAIIKKSKILVLDDSTSALDMETEYKVLKALKSNNEHNFSTFIVAHRISGVKDADLILFMRNGEIVEQGSHSQLLDKQGEYYKIYLHQFGDYESLIKEGLLNE
ncbi:MAG: ABC transporter ATP-binding protein [Clostridium sp.]